MCLGLVQEGMGGIAILPYRRFHLPVNARAKNMLSREVKRLCFRCQTLKFPHLIVVLNAFSPPISVIFAGCP